MTITIAQPVPAKNGKSALLLNNNAAWIEKNGPGKSTPFRPNSFDEGNDAARVACSIIAEGDLAEWAQSTDEQLIAIISANSAFYLGKEMTEDQIRAAHCPLYRTHEKYSASVKCKVNRQGPRSTRFWTQNGERTTEIEDWTMCNFAPRLWLKSVWITPGARQRGVSLEMTDVQVTETSQECPFEVTDTDPFA